MAINTTKTRAKITETTPFDGLSVAEFVAKLLSDQADPIKAGPMAAYMKTKAPFYGVQKPERVEIFKMMISIYKPETHAEYVKSTTALWDLPHREEKYAAIEFAMAFPEFIKIDSIKLYEHMIRDGAWWDLVDGIAANLVGGALATDRQAVTSILDRWISNKSMWLRRATIIAQLRHKDKTDPDTLFRYCRAQASEDDFFIRKAIGWALREYSKSEPEKVKGFILANQGVLSSLSYRESSKHLRHIGIF